MLILCVRLGRYFNSRPHGGRLRWAGRNVWNSLFQLTPSRRATSSSPALVTARTISTHALTEGDKKEGSWLSAARYFNSRPHGGRLSSCVIPSTISSFQLTPSRRATVSGNLSVSGSIFQLTPSRRATFSVAAR